MKPALAILILALLLTGCASRRYVRDYCDTQHAYARGKALEHNYNTVRYIGDMERRIDQCVVAGPHLRAMLQSRADVYEELQAAKDSLARVEREMGDIEDRSFVEKREGVPE